MQTFKKVGLSIKVTDSKFYQKKLCRMHNIMEEIAWKMKIYENSLMVRVLNCADEDNETAHNLHWQLVVRKSSAVKEYSY